MMMTQIGMLQTQMQMGAIACLAAAMADSETAATATAKVAR
jgi:hypothetical protein